MARVHGKATVVTLGGSDLSVHSNTLEWSRKADKHDLTCFGVDDHVYQGGLGDGSAKVGGWYDSAAVTGPRAIIEPKVGTVVACVYRPEGTGSGKPQDTVNALVEEYMESAPVADYVQWSASLQFSGPVTTVAQ
jgi:hypothetical protein